jgi:uncharacterized protein (DUF1501 family)
MNINNLDRRHFLKLGSQTLAGAGLYASLGAMQRVLAASSTTGYKALVCVFLNGGNDAFNWLVPTDNTGYGVYSNSRKNLALAQSSLLALNGSSFGVHANCPELQALFNAGKGAFVQNVGPLVQPTTVAQFKAESVPLPPQLFSHSDQQALWQTSISNSRQPYGWGGRIADLLASQGYNPKLSMNISLNGNNIFQGGQRTVFYNLGQNGAPEMNIYKDTNYRGGKRRELFLKLLAQSNASQHALEKEFSGTLKRSYELADFVNTGLKTVPELTTAFPTDNLGRQLRMVAKSIRARTALEANRQIFFVSMGGFDTHDTQLTDHANQLGKLSKALKAFQDALAEIGMERDVTTFTMSDFGRTLTSNGDGSDHGWGAHAWVQGGAVLGGKLYGTAPDLAIKGRDDGGAGRIVPTISTDEYAASLARWFGVSNGDLGLVFPNLKNFSQAQVGFL